MYDIVSILIFNGHESRTFSIYLLALPPPPALLCQKKSSNSNVGTTSMTLGEGRAIEIGTNYINVIKANPLQLRTI